MVRVSELPTFDMADVLESKEDILIYLNQVIEENDPSELAHALGVIVRSKGMSEIAQHTGITREALYKALKPNTSPRFDTINRVLNALGLKLQVLSI